MREETKFLVLRIKKFYFDQIDRGEKLIEFRSDTPFYRKRIKNQEFLILHYQTDDKLLCRIDRISKIKNRLSAKEKAIVPTDYIFALRLTKLKRFRTFKP